MGRLRRAVLSPGHLRSPGSGGGRGAHGRAARAGRSSPSIGLLLAVVVVVVGFADGEGASGDPKRVKTVFFGEVETDGVALAVMDAGTHGVQGHAIVVGSDGSATWDRGLDSLEPRGREGHGGLELTDDERRQIEAWSSAAWNAAGPRGRRSFLLDPWDGPPRWVWAVVVPRRDDVRLVEGSAIGWMHGPLPPPLRALLDWLVRRVDELSQEPP